MSLTLPTARNVNIVVQDLENEVLIYDFQINKAYCLNETSGTIYRHCNGKTSFDELKRRYQYTDDLIYLALDELQKNNLVESEAITHFAGMSRRDAIKKVGFGTMLALPVITALAAPQAIHAASNCAADTQACTFDNYTQSNCCPNLRCNGGSVCQSCFNSGSAYYNPNTGGSPSQATCNTRPERNLCCNPAATPTVSGSNCLCG